MPVRAIHYGHASTTVGKTFVIARAHLAGRPSFYLVLVIISYSVIACISVPLRPLSYSIPLLLSTTVIYFGKACAFIERTNANTCYAVGYRYARKACTTGERIRADACYAVGYRYAHKACASIERTSGDALTAGYNHLFKR